MFTTILAWFKSLFSSALSNYIMPVWNDIETKAGPALGTIIEAGLAAAAAGTGNGAVFTAVKTAATTAGVQLLDYELGFISNSLQHPTASTATIAAPVPVVPAAS